MLTKLKKLIQAYAFAQPSKRFSLKVLKARNESNNWMYAPSADNALTNAALKIVGREVAACCVLKECSSGCPEDSDSGIQGSYNLVALLPRGASGVYPLLSLPSPLTDCYRYPHGEQRVSIY